MRLADEWAYSSGSEAKWVSCNARMSKLNADCSRSTFGTVQCIMFQVPTRNVPLAAVLPAADAPPPATCCAGGSLLRAKGLEVMGPMGPHGQ